MNFIRTYSRPDTQATQESDGFYNHWRGASILKWTDEAITEFVNCFQRAPRGASFGIGHYMHGMPCTIDNQATPLLRDEHRSSYFFNMSWGHSNQTSEAMQWVDQSIKDMQPHNRTSTYVNYLSSNDPAAIEATYGVNYPRLQKLKSKYDPENVFHLNRNIRA
jgi:hypothetical protein